MTNDDRIDDYEERDRKETIKLDSWKLRRRVIFITLLFCAASVAYLLVLGEDTRLNETIANGLILLASSTIFYYVAGSVYEDSRRSRRR